MRLDRTAAALLAALLAACSPAAPRVSPTPSPSPTATLAPPRAPAPPPPPPFDAARAFAHAKHLAEVIGEREAGSAGYRKAADYAARVFTSLGYTVTRQRVRLPAGTSAGVRVPAGETQNIVAEPPGFDPGGPHVLVGAHLDTVENTPGANDNGSGSGVLFELARIAAVSPPRVPIVWVAFGGEERRRPGASGALFGSRHFVSVMGKARHAGLERVLVLDMVGNGTRVLVCHSGLTPRDFVRAALAAAARLKIPARERVVGGAFSDYKPFEDAGFTIAWLWAGENATFHTPRDKTSVLQMPEIKRVGAVAWETLLALRL